MTVAKYGVGVIGTGKYYPEKVLSNDLIEAECGLKPGTIEKKTGVKSRRIASDNETASEFSVEAAKQAIEKAGIEIDEIDLIICCTFTGDYVYPALACKVQQMLGAHQAGAFDVMANCTGFQVGLTVASDRMKADPNIRNSIVIGTALQSRYINWSDPESAMYFGDGAGAVVLAKVPDRYGILASDIQTNGTAYEAVRMRGGGSSFPMRPDNINDGLNFYEMNGMEVWKQVIKYQPKVMRRCLDKIGKKPDEVDFFVFHQANLNLIEFLMARMKQSMEKTFTNVSELGNTADASMAIALCDADHNGLIKHDDLVIISGVGAGFIFGATVIKWYKKNG